MIATYCVLILFVSWLLWHYVTFNGLVTARNAVEQSWSNVEVQLKRRLDLISNLVEVVKGYAKHEGGTLQNVVAARSKMERIHDATEATESTELLSESLNQIFAVVERYPDLKANNQFLQLQTELTTTENLVAERRHAYNRNVSYYENLRLAFPQRIVAEVHDFKAVSLFDAPDNVINEAVQVRFS